MSKYLNEDDSTRSAAGSELAIPHRSDKHIDKVVEMLEKVPAIQGKGVMPKRKSQVRGKVALIACLECRRTRSRCEGDYPNPCARCRTQGYHCKYSTHTKLQKDTMLSESERESAKTESLYQPNLELLESLGLFSSDQTRAESREKTEPNYSSVANQDPLSPNSFKTQQLIPAGSSEAMMQTPLVARHTADQQNAHLRMLINKQGRLIMDLNSDLAKITEDRDQYQKRCKELADSAEASSSHNRTILSRALSPSLPSSATSSGRSMPSLQTSDANHSGIDCFVRLLLKDTNVRSACESSVQCIEIGLDRLARNLQRMLKVFGKHLVQSSTNDAERQAALLVLHNYANISSLVRSRFDATYTHQISTPSLRLRSIPPKNERRAGLDSSSPNKIASPSLHESATDSLSSENLEHAAKLHSEDETSEDEDEAHDDLEKPYGPWELVRIDEVEHFLFTGDAFKVFNQSLQDFVQAGKRQASRDYLHKHEAATAKPILTEDEQNTHKGLARKALFPTLSSGIWLPMKSQFVLRKIDSHLRRLLRPPLATGCVRIEWICPTGTQHAGTVADTTSTALVSGVGAFSQNNGNAITYDGIRDSSQIVLSNDLGLRRDQQHGTEAQRWLEVCVNTGRYTASLAEIDVTKTANDQQLFSQIANRYHELRGKGFKRMFMKPTHIHYVSFHFRRAHRVFIRDTPMALPPQEEVKEGRYHYACSQPPPMNAQEFFHYFYNHAECHPQLACLDVLPKKIGSSLIYSVRQSPVNGWGIHIVEGPNRVLLTWCCVGILIVSMGISIIYSIVMRTSEQGFGIGSWLVAVLSTVLTALYFQWEEEG